MKGILAVDLAAKFSAAVTMTYDHEVVDQHDSWHLPERKFVERICDPFDTWGTFYTGVDWLVVEDLPARVMWTNSVKDVCRLQGRLKERLDEYEALGRLVLVQPETWREHYKPDLKRGTGPDAVVGVAAQYGYQSPDLTDRLARHPDNPDRILAGERPTARKVGTDYCAAYLIARWAVDRLNTHGDLNAPRTTRFE